MGEINIIGILAQIPFLAVFIWYFDRSSRQFQDFLREERASREANAKEERAAREEFEQELALKFEQVATIMKDHDVKFDRAIAIMEERTKKTTPTSRRSQ